MKIDYVRKVLLESMGREVFICIDGIVVGGRVEQVKDPIKANYVVLLQPRLYFLGSQKPAFKMQHFHIHLADIKGIMTSV